MTDSLGINGCTIRLVKGDITDIDVQSFVFYAQHNLALGAGFGTAISVRGGPSIQEELKQFGTLQTTDAIVTKAGKMKAEYIVHAVGPRFQEEDTEKKLRATVINSLQRAEEKGIETVAFPPMGTGFYGVPLDVSARVTLDTIKEYISGETKIKEVVICLLDSREYRPFHKQLSSMRSTKE
jgi:O-acetyl-ADP-ribose deacetylase (regulator of RNase III)